MIIKPEHIGKIRARATGFAAQFYLGEPRPDSIGAGTRDPCPAYSFAVIWGSRDPAPKISARWTGFEPAISAVTGQRFKPAKLPPHNLNFWYGAGRETFKFYPYFNFLTSSLNLSPLSA